MALYNTGRFLEFVLDLCTVNRPPGGMSDGVSVCIRAVLTMQTIWHFQHIHVSYKKTKLCSQSLLNS